MKNKIKKITEQLRVAFNSCKNNDFDKILSEIKNNEDSLFVYSLIIEILKKGKNNVFKIEQYQFDKLIAIFIKKTLNSKKDFENRVFDIIKENQESGYEINTIYETLYEKIYFMDKIFVKISNIKNKDIKLNIQNSFVKNFLLSNNNSILNMVILNKMKKHFEDEILKGLSININESDFKKYSVECKIPKIKYKHDFLMPLFITDSTNSVIKKEVLNREFRISDSFYSINEKSQEINILNKNLKDMIVALNASILYTNCKNKNLEKFNIIIKETSLYSECFLEYYNNINNYLVNNNFFMALKESILFLEFYIRAYSKTNNETKKEIIKIEKNKKELSNNQIIKTLKELEGELENKYINEYNEIKEKELLNFNLNIDKVSIETLLVAMNKSNKITNEEVEMLNYLLLNNKNEGLNLRNKIFHSLTLESDIKHELGEWKNQLFFFIIMYLIIFILKYNILEENERFNYTIKEKENFFSIEFKG